jgi:5-methylcytosine-specific restriction endonuclease McrA
VVTPAPPHEEFLQSYEWRRLRMEVLVERGARCECCGISPKDGAVMNVDHIKPRLRFPHLKLEKSNLQVLCGPCNHGKGNWDETDWRQEGVATVTPPPQRDPMAPRLVRAG